MKTSFSLCFLSFFIFSCNSQKNKLPDYIKLTGDSIKIDIKTTRTNISHKVLRMDSVFIELPGFTLKGKLLFSIRDSFLLLATSKSDKAYVINLTSMDRIKEYKLRDIIESYIDITAPTCACALDLNRDLQALDFYSNENIILQTEDRLSMINVQGNLVDSIQFKSKKFSYSNIFDVPVEYSPITNKIYIYKYCYGCKRRSVDYYSYAVESSIDIITKEMEEENIKYPEIYNHFSFGMLDNVHKTSYKNYQYFSFEPDHRLYIYNILNKETKIYGGQSAYSTGCIRILNKKENKNEESMFNQAISADLYYQLVYDDVNNRYYRLFMHPNKIDPVINAIYYDMYMQIFNSKFQIEDEVKLDTMNNYYYTFNGKLYCIDLRKDGAMFYSYTFD